MGIQRSRHKFGRKLACRARYGQAANDYFYAAGVTDPTGRREVAGFLNVLRDLGLWDSCILGMALAGRHNAGSGTRAHAFKGGYGTLMNGPAWGVSGLLMDGTTTTVNLSDKAALTNSVRSAVAVVRVAASPSLCNFVLAVDDGTATGIQIGLRVYSGSLGDPGPGLYVTRAGTGSLNLSPGRSTNLNQWQTFAACMDASSDQVYQNATLVSGGGRSGLPAINPTGTPTTAALGGGSGTGACTQSAGLLLLFSTTLGAVQVGQLHEVIRLTLLPEIGLPVVPGVQQPGFIP